MYEVIQYIGKFMNDILKEFRDICKDIVSNLLELKIPELNIIDFILLFLFTIFILICKLFADVCFHSYITIIIYVILDIVLLFRFIVRRQNNG